MSEIKKKKMKLREDDAKGTRYTFRVGDKHRNKIDNICEKTGKSKSDVLREALDNYFRKKE